MEIKDKVGRLARISGWTILAVCLPWAFWWYWHVPTTGKGGLLLAFVATVMPLVWDDIQAIGRAGLILTLVVLFAVEYRAIDQEHQAYADDQTKARADEQLSFQKLLKAQDEDVANILKQEKSDLRDILTQEEEHFDRMMATNTKARKQESEEFSALLNIEKKLFASEEQLFQSLNGQLIPANDPTPQTPCGALSADQYLISINGGGHMFRKFPHVVLVYNRDKIVWLDKRTDGSIALFMDIKDEKGRIALRIDKDGFFVHPGANLFARRPDKSSLVVQDEYGADVLTVRYANPQAFVVTGRLAEEALNIGCMNGDFTADVVIENAPPPKKP